MKRVEEVVASRSMPRRVEAGRESVRRVAGVVIFELDRCVKIGLRAVCETWRIRGARGQTYGA